MLCGLCLCSAILWVALRPVAAWSQEAQGVTEAVSAAPTPAEADAKKAIEKEKRTRAYAGLMALVGIVVTGLAVVAVVMLWARRLRRINRMAPTRTVVKDELWFLQPSRPGNQLPNRNPPRESPPPSTASDE